MTFNCTEESIKNALDGDRFSEAVRDIGQGKWILKIVFFVVYCNRTALKVKRCLIGAMLYHWSPNFVSLRHRIQENGHFNFSGKSWICFDLRRCRIAGQSNELIVQRNSQSTERVAQRCAVEFHFHILLWSPEGSPFRDAWCVHWNCGIGCHGKCATGIDNTIATVNVSTHFVPKSGERRPREDFHILENRFGTTVWR